ncbi:transglycosylase SLT domain-containing protein [Heyndrickxia acidicola]
MYPSPAEKDLAALATPVKVKNAILSAEGLIKNSPSKLADQYKIIVFNMDQVTQSSYKDQLKKDTAFLAASIPSTYKTGQLAALIQMEPQFEQLDGLVSKWKSDALVPGIYSSITSEMKSFSGTDQSNLQKRLSDIMDRLKASPADIKNMLDLAARKYGIPPEIVKSIALTENGSLTQFTSSGDVFTSLDSGYGIMQVTPLSPSDSSYDWNRVKYDLQYNIETGVQILKEKWGYKSLPTVNHQNINSLEDWYFAVMAYNSVSQVNTPGNGKAYQDKVYRYLFNDALIEGDTFTKPVIKEPVTMNGTQFNAASYTTNYQHVSTQMHQTGDKVTLLKGARLRQSTSTNAQYITLSVSQQVSLASGPIEDNTPSNLYCWYKVLYNGKSYYVASINIQ